jgi:predicted DNA-binding transcriptional regulator AlpA
MQRKSEISPSTLAAASLNPTLGKAGSQAPRDDEMMSMGAVLEFFGGDTPLHYSTLYRGIAAGRYPKPVSIGPNSRRWLRSECRDARQKLIDARDNELGRAHSRRGRSRQGAGQENA